MRTVRNVIRMVWNSIEQQKAESVPVCIAPFNTNVVKRGRGVKPGENGSRMGLTGGVHNSIGMKWLERYVFSGPGSPVCTSSGYGLNVLYGVWARYMHHKSPVMSRQYRLSCILNTFDTFWSWFLPVR